MSLAICRNDASALYGPLDTAYKKAFGTNKVRDVEQLGKAKQQYSGWVRIYGCFWPPALYKSAAFQQVYTEEKFWNRGTELISMLLEGHSPTLSGFLMHRGSSSSSSSSSRGSQSDTATHITIKLLSIRCGPGVDAVAAVTCLRSVSRAAITFNVTLVDAAAGWEGKAVAAVKAAGAGDSVTFMAGSFGDEAVLNAAAAADVVITSHLLVDLDKSNKAGPAEAFFSNTIDKWAAAAPGSPPRLIIYADAWQPYCWRSGGLLDAKRGVKLHDCFRRKAGEKEKKNCLGVVQVGPAAASLAAAPAGADLAEAFGSLAV